jgi:hypothetical protein
VTQRAGSLRALTGLTDAECQALLPHVAQAFVTHRHDRTIAGQPRTSRRYSTYDTCPRPTLADKRLWMLTDLKPNPLQAGQGQLVGMRHSQANTWMHVRPPVLHQALADPARLPARTAAELAALFKTPATNGGATPPLFGMLAPHVRSTARPLPKRHKKMTVARRRVTRAKTSS